MALQRKSHGEGRLGGGLTRKNQNSVVPRSYDSPDSDRRINYTDHSYPCGSHNVGRHAVVVLEDSIKAVGKT